MQGKVADIRSAYMDALDEEGNHMNEATIQQVCCSALYLRVLLHLRVFALPPVASNTVGATSSPLYSTLFFCTQVAQAGLTKSLKVVVRVDAVIWTFGR